MSGDRAGVVDEAWEIYQKHCKTCCPKCFEDYLLKTLEQQAYAITGGVFSHPRSDVVNESLTRAWKSLGKFRGESRFSTWFHRIVLNVCKAHGAKETLQRKREVPLSDEALIVHYAAAGRGVDPHFLNAFGTLRQAEVEFMADKLKSPPMPDAEVAKKWGLSLSGVRGRWRRIKKKIQAALE